jgi:hypothetical protein
MYTKLPALFESLMTRYLLRQIAGFIDISVTLFLQLIYNLPLLLSFILVVLYLLFEIVLRLFMQFRQAHLFLSLSGGLDHILHGSRDKSHHP